MILSIIIPVYNVEKYIEKCLTSIVNQITDDIEIVIVNDGSQDSSFEIAKEILKDIENVRYIEQENQGLSAARNKGLEVANGSYVWFVDSDDYIVNENFKKLCKVLYKDRRELLTVGYNLFDDESGDIIQKFNFNNAKIVSTDIALGEIPNPNCNVWRYIVSKDLLKTNNITFNEGVLCEDIEWCTELFIHIEEVQILNLSLYNYRQNRQNSIMANVNLKRVQDAFLNIERTKYNLKNSDLKLNVYLKLRINLFKQYLYNIYNISLLKSDDKKLLPRTLKWSKPKIIFINILMLLLKLYKKLR